MSIIERIHARHVAIAFFDEACLLCVEAQAKRPAWVRRLPLIARELGTRKAFA